MLCLPCRPAGALSLRWRQLLTSHLHQRYCSGHAFYTLQQQQQQEAGDSAPDTHVGEAADGPLAAGDQLPLFRQAQDSMQAEMAGSGKQRKASGADNPDQRIASDAAALCDDLSEVAKVAAAAPFKLLYYRRDMQLLEDVTRPTSAAPASLPA